MKIGIAGAPGSFSQEAAETYINRHTISDTSIAHLVSSESVLSSLDSHDIDLGIFPIENSNGGVVIESIYAMAAHTFSIKELFEIDVQHCLLAKPGVATETITHITSHDQALKQCRTYLKRAWPEIQVSEYSDTALAAKDLCDGEIPASTAVIAPYRCAQLYGLEVLERGVQDLKFNFTAFIAAEKL